MTSIRVIRLKTLKKGFQLPKPEYTKPRHIAFVIDSMLGGGAERICLNVIKMMLKKNHKVDLILLKYSGPRLIEIPRAVNLFVIDKRFPKKKYTEKCSIEFEEIQWIKPLHGVLSKIRGFLRAERALEISNRSHRIPHRRHLFQAISMAFYIDTERPDIIFSILGASNLASLLGRKLSVQDVPVICSIHNAPEFDRFFAKNTMLSQLYPDADSIHTVSYGIADSLSNMIPSTKDKLVPIHNPIYLTEIKKLTEQPVEHPWLNSIPANFSHGSESNVILAAGRFDSQKNFPMLLQAFARTKTKRDIRLIILGDGQERRYYQQIISELKIGNFVSMPGWVNNPYAFMSRARMVVLTSNTEGFPVVLIEAIACGTPIISTDCPYGPNELLENGRWGRLVPSGEPALLADAIGEELDIELDRKRLQRRASQFTPEILSGKYEHMINRTISNYEESKQMVK